MWALSLTARSVTYTQLKLRQLLRGIACDIRSLFGSLWDYFPSQQLYLRVGFAHYFLWLNSAKLVRLESQYSSRYFLHIYYVYTNFLDLPEVLLFSVRLPPIRNVVDATLEGCISCSKWSILVAPSGSQLFTILKKPTQHSGRRKWVKDRLIFTSEYSLLLTS